MSAIAPRDRGAPSRHARKTAPPALAVLILLAAAACQATASQPSSRPPTPSPTPAGGPYTFVVPGLGRQAVVDLPPGWETDGATASRRSAEDGTRIAISVWVVQQVYADPCSWTGTEQKAPRTAEGLAAMLAAQPGRRATSSRISLGSMPAERVIMRVADDLDVATCDGGELRTWAARGGTFRTAEGPGERDEVYVFTVGKKLAVVDASYFADASSDELAELHRILATLEFTRPG